VAGIAAFGLFEIGTAALQVRSVVVIGISWIVSPISGFLAALLLHLLLDWALLRRHTARGDSAGVGRWTGRIFPLCAAATLGFMALTVLLAVQKSAGGVPLAVMITLPLAVAAGAGVAVWLWLLPLWQAHQEEWGPRVARVLHWGESPETEAVAEEPAGATTVQERDKAETGESDLLVRATPEQLAAAAGAAQRLFVSLMVVTAAIVAFSHAANDISNSVAPFLVCYEWVAAQSVDPDVKARKHSDSN
jgi:phosphate/sulfate permease